MGVGCFDQATTLAKPEWHGPDNQLARFPGTPRPLRREFQRTPEGSFCALGPAKWLRVNPHGSPRRATDGEAIFGGSSRILSESVLCSEVQYGANLQLQLHPEGNALPIEIRRLLAGGLTFSQPPQIVEGDGEQFFVVGIVREHWFITGVI